MSIRLIQPGPGPFSQLGLPEDYDTLTVDGQRLARVNACRQYLAPASEEVQARRFVRCLHFFDSFYLCPQIDSSGDVLFDPYFYDKWLPPPALHDSLAYYALRYKTSAAVAPRGFAKTKLLQKIILLTMSACPAFSWIYATSVQSISQRRGAEVKLQFDLNQRLNDDFGPEYGGTFKPGRGVAAWGMGDFMLSNRSSMFCTSAESCQRGSRPRAYALDDPEFDAEKSTSTENLREGAERLIFKIALPMVARAGSRLIWWGTFVSKQHYLWAALQVDQNGNPTDTRFGRWNRVIIPLRLPQADGTFKSAWPEQHPIDLQEKQRLALSDDTETIPELRDRVGEPVFLAEYDARPGDSGLNVFGELSVARHGYWIEQPDAFLVSAPWMSNAQLCFFRKGAVVRHSLNELPALGWRLYMTADTSYTAKVTSDYKAAGVFAVTPQGEIFFLDAWAAQCKPNLLTMEILRLAERWRASPIYPEAIKEGATIVDDLAAAIRDNASEILHQFDWLPNVVPYNPGMTPKPSRIAASLTRRFEHGLIKLPAYGPLAAFREDVHPWNMLFSQIRGFNPYSDDCGLQHDDLVDILGMAGSSKILKGLPQTPVSIKAQPVDHVAKMLKGDLIDENGQPRFLLCLDKLTTADALTIAANYAPKDRPLIE